MEPGFGKRLMHVLRTVYHMLRRGLCRKRLMIDLHQLLGRGKLAGKVFRNLVAAVNHAHGAAHLAVVGFGSGAGASSSSSALSFSHDPRDVEFSCTTTPSYVRGGALFPFRIRGRGAGRGGGGQFGGIDSAEVARVFQMMNSEEAGAGGETSSEAGATPSPMLALSLGRSPAGVRQLRVTDSPFPIEPEGVDERVDAHADDFIKKFYEQLQLQQAFATPDNCVRRRG
ncbi:uncharacterized protein LOC133909841 [Phragmites australis]|uniref:uncharacterized protein LOC133909841 n=1 Tax=Phragmites australis TaxID=29695 RepID=UPI002D774E5A|nr:uncharacterized protein LOC133909841 [Phragmites australis]